MNSVSGFESGSKFALVSAVSSQNPAFFHGTMAKERLTRLTDRHVPWWFDIISENRWLGEPVARFGATLPRTIITYNIHLKKNTDFKFGTLVWPSTTAMGFGESFSSSELESRDIIAHY